MNPRPGDHLVVSRGSYTHHGIYEGDGTVIHFVGLRASKDLAIVRRDTLEAFADGAAIEVHPYNGARCFPPDEIVRRARSQLGKRGYHVLNNNCEVLARWAVTNDAHSEQALRAMSFVTGSVGASFAAVGAVGAIGWAAAPHASGAARISSGLASVGGSMMGGVLILSSLPAATAIALFWAAMRDDPTQTEVERSARACARYVALGTGVVSLGIVALLLRYLGGGKGAAGMSAALRAMGSIAGGGMAHGVAVTGVGMSMASVAAGLAAYRAMGGAQRIIVGQETILDAPAPEGPP